MANGIANRPVGSGLSEAQPMGRGNDMKKIAAVCLLLLLLSPGQSMAAETVPEATDELVVEYTAIADLMTEHNPVIKSNASALKAMEYGYESLDDALALASMAARLYGNLADGVMIDEAAPDGDPNSRVLQQYLAGQEDAMVNSAVGIIDSKEDMARLIENTKLQMEAGNKQLIWTAESLYFTYHNLVQQRAELTDNLVLLRRQQAVTQLRQALGLASEYDVLVMAAQVKELETGLNTLSGQTDNLVQNFNLLLGRAYDEPLVMAAPPAVRAVGELPDIEADLVAAEANCYAIKLAKYSLGDKKVAYRRLKQDNGISDSDVEDERQDDERWYNQAQQLVEEIKSGEAKVNDLVRSFRTELAQARQEIADKAAALELAELKLANEKTTLAQMSLRYELGLISTLALEGVEAGYAAQERKVEAAGWELLLARRQYEWMVQGLSFSASGSAAF